MNSIKMKQKYFKCKQSINMRTKVIIFFLIIMSCIINTQAQAPAHAIEKIVDHYGKEGLFNGSILVAQKGKVIYKKGVGYANMEWNIPNTTTTKFRLGSITKQFTSMLIMQLVNEGKLKLDGKITDYLPHYRKETGDKVTIHHLLTHSSGIPNYTDNQKFWQDNKRSYSVTDFTRIYCSDDLEFEPGSRFTYSNSGYFILGAIIEAITKKPYHEVLQNKILDVVEMKNTGYDFSEKIIDNRAAGYIKTLDGYKNAEYLDMGLPYAAGSLYSTVEDLHLWDRALYTEKLLPDSLKKKLFGPYVKVEDVITGNSGYGWFTAKQKLPLSKKELEMIWHTGGINGFLTTINRYPETETLIVVLDNSSQSIGEQDLAIHILEILHGANPPIPKAGLAAVLQNKIINGSVSKAVDFYNNLSQAQRKEYDLTGTEPQINRWGYTYLNDKKQVDDAIKLFALNTKLFPNSSNVYDSYAEALMYKGDYANAISNYKKSHALDSTNRYALDMIAQMGSPQKQDTIRVMVDGHAMDLFVSGKEGPVVVLEAGGNSDHRSWNSIVPELSKFARVVTYDRPGYLNSIACNRPRTSLRVADELHEALVKANIKGPYIMGGWSWGGAFAKVFAGKYPGETKGLLLVDPAAKKVYDEMAAQYPDVFTRIYQERTANNPAAQDEFDAMLPTMYQADEGDKTYSGNTILLIAGSDADWKDYEKPLQKIWINELSNWANRRPNTTYEVVESGHFIQREKPETVISAVKRLIK